MTTIASLGPYLLVALLAIAWVLAEIVQTFHGDVSRAMKSRWTAFFVILNVAFALLAYLLVRLLAPASTNPWLLALAAGAGWQALLRTRVNLLQPLDPEEGEAVSLSLADLYNRFQQFCRAQIDQALAGERMRLLERATHFPAEDLEQQVRLFAYASVLHSSEDVEAYLEKLREKPPQQRALLLASYLLREGGYGLFRERLKVMERKQRPSK
jgi:hypothetical protein